jgi:hypothetical protein
MYLGSQVLFAVGSEYEKCSNESSKRQYSRRGEDSDLSDCARNSKIPFDPVALIEFPDAPGKEKPDEDDNLAI